MIIKDTASPAYVHNYCRREKPLTEAKKTQVINRSCVMLEKNVVDVHLFILFCFYFKPTKIIKRARELTKLDKKMYIIVSYCL